jgi:hypothetical protein
MAAFLPDRAPADQTLFVPEPANRVGVILNTDTKNEADDQYAIVHAILMPLRLPKHRRHNPVFG